MTRKRVVAIIGSYRRGGTTERAVEAVLEGARTGGAITHTTFTDYVGVPA